LPKKAGKNKETPKVKYNTGRFFFLSFSSSICKTFAYFPPATFHFNAVVAIVIQTLHQFQW
jgi:hypothetical protein